jgi:hypothetical protein
MNLISNDASKLDMLFALSHIYFLYPIGILASVYMLFGQLGLLGLSGLPLVIVCLGINVFLGKISVNFKYVFKIFAQFFYFI